jgi:hypothetical protein
LTNSATCCIIKKSERYSDRNDKRREVNAAMTILVVAALGVAFTLGFGLGAMVVNRLRSIQLAERDRRIAELETQIRGDGPSRNGRWHG